MNIISHPDRRIWDRLWDVAWDNKNDYRSRHAAAIVHRGVIISLGKNRSKTHPIQDEFKKNEHAIWLHAEIDAIVKACNKRLTPLDFQDMMVYIGRVKYSGDKKTWGNSAPCPGCLAALTHFKFRGIQFSMENSEFSTVLFNSDGEV